MMPLFLWVLALSSLFSHIKRYMAGDSKQKVAAERITKEKLMSLVGIVAILHNTFNRLAYIGD